MTGLGSASYTGRRTHFCTASRKSYLALVQDLCPRQHQSKVSGLTEFCQQSDSPVVPGPYYGGDAGFEEVLDLVEDACNGLPVHVIAVPIIKEGLSQAAYPPQSILAGSSISSAWSACHPPRY